MRIFFALFLMAAAGCGGSEPAGGGDMGTDDGGTKAFGETCAMDNECASNVCFVGGNRSFCSMHCTMATAATDCPNPPTSGTCNMQGFCKAP
jgi:hypothetical protein